MTAKLMSFMSCNTRHHSWQHTHVRADFPILGLTFGSKETTHKLPHSHHVHKVAQLQDYTTATGGWYRNGFLGWSFRSTPKRVGRHAEARDAMQLPNLPTFNVAQKLVVDVSRNAGMWPLVCAKAKELPQQVCRSLISPNFPKKCNWPVKSRQ